jgi:predicted nucleic acid-binding protein
MSEMSESTFVVDTSVVLKWLRRDEPLFAEARVLRQRLLEGEIRLAAPFLLAYELANVLHYKREMSTAEVMEAVRSIYETGLEWYGPTQALIERTIEIARIYDIAAYDATFVALAEALGGEFITADEKAFRRLTSLPYVKFLGN